MDYGKETKNQVDNACEQGVLGQEHEEMTKEEFDVSELLDGILIERDVADSIWLEESKGWEDKTHQRMKSIIEKAQKIQETVKIIQHGESDTPPNPCGRWK